MVLKMAVLVHESCDQTCFVTDGQNGNVVQEMFLA